MDNTDLSKKGKLKITDFTSNQDIEDVLDENFDTKLKVNKIIPRPNKILPNNKPLIGP